MEDESQASALHQLSEIGFYDFWTEVKKMFPLFLEFLEFEENFRFRYLIQEHFFRQFQDGQLTSGHHQS